MNGQACWWEREKNLLSKDVKEGMSKWDETNRPKDRQTDRQTHISATNKSSTNKMQCCAMNGCRDGYENATNKTASSNSIPLKMAAQYLKGSCHKHRPRQLPNTIRQINQHASFSSDSSCPPPSSDSYRRGGGLSGNKWGKKLRCIIKYERLRVPLKELTTANNHQFCPFSPQDKANNMSDRVRASACIPNISTPHTAIANPLDRH
jgi:hypothetical protein